jgi:phenylacetate-CoA ligase
MLIIRGVNIFPSQIESILLDIEGLEPHYQIIVEREGNLDRMEILIEVSDKIFDRADEVKVLQSLEKRIQHDIKDYLGITADVKLVGPRTLKRTEGKAKRVIDKRHIM